MRLLLLISLILSLARISYGAETQLFKFKEKCRSIAQAKAWRFRVPKTLFDSNLLDTTLPDLNTNIFPKLLNLQDWTPVDRPPLAKWFMHQFEALKKKAKLDTTGNESWELVPMIKGFMIDSPEVLSTSVVLWDESEVKAALLKDIKFASLCEIILLLSGGQDAMIEPLDDAIAEQIVLRVQLLPSYKIALPEIRINESSHGFGTNFLVLILVVALFFSVGSCLSRIKFWLCPDFEQDPGPPLPIFAKFEQSKCTKND